MKRIIKLTESDLKRIVKKVVKEQLDERESIMAIQQFLNDRYKKDPKFKQLTVDGKTGPNSQTENAIKKYQAEKRVLDVDGQIGPNTIELMRKDGLGKYEKKYKLFGLF